MFFEAIQIECISPILVKVPPSHLFETNIVSAVFFLWENWYSMLIWSEPD